MELKIKVDSNNVAKQMVRMMLENLHLSITGFANQKFGSIHTPMGMPLYPQSFPGYPGNFPSGHPYAQASQP